MTQKGMLGKRAETIMIKAVRIPIWTSRSRREMVIEGEMVLRSRNKVSGTRNQKGLSVKTIQIEEKVKKS